MAEVNSMDTTTQSGDETDGKFIRPKTKKKKTTSDASITVGSQNKEFDIVELRGLLESVETFLKNSKTQYILSYDQFEKFLSDSWGITNAQEIAEQYTEDTEALIQMIEAVYPHLKTKALKNRCTRIKKKIKGDDKSDSDLSQN
ncbi:hypothetical protein QAD02_003717 [Eretmocerus hayati]|uniref:Uncharacterized protein n=1 Tax=Eretmocerus hayati TaxID=131215 RepID=A0ACC2NMM6_9HYME|nr:hypothetical protein QAD02_003717 [Eretmocerus hayati]